MQRVLHLLSVLPILLILAGCGALGAQATATPSAIPPTDTPAPTVTPTPTPRSATIKTIEGTVQLRVGKNGKFAAAAVGQTMSEGDELKTGKDGRVMLVLDDGTGMVLAADSSLDLTSLEGTHETPISQFLLNIGSVFAIGHGELPPDATYEIDTPKGVATIRGSMLGVLYSTAGGAQVTCLIGHCGASLNGKDVDLTGGQKVTITSQGPSAPITMTPAEKLEWSKALKTATDAGLQTSQSISSTCSCSGKDMKCSDGTTVSNFPTCIQGPACACSAGGLTCGAQTTANSPVCSRGASDCTCSGPNLICAGGQTYYNVSACTGGATCVCNGPDLTCTDGTTYPADPACSARTGCTCSQGIQVCADGSVSFNTGTCLNASSPCTCQGSTLVCNTSNGSATVPNSPLCGGKAGTGGSRTCVCSNHILACSDGTVGTC